MLFVTIDTYDLLSPTVSIRWEILVGFGRWDKPPDFGEVMISMVAQKAQTADASMKLPDKYPRVVIAPVVFMSL